MGNEYYIVKGENHYLVDLETGEGYAFDNFGKSIGPVDACYASIMGFSNPVDILSILCDTSPICEVYYKGKKLRLNEKGMSVYRKIPKEFPRKTYIAFRVIRNECLGLTQILIPFEKDCVSFNDLSNVLGSYDWK